MFLFFFHSETNSKSAKSEPVRTIEESPSHTPKTSFGASNRGLVFVHQPNDVVTDLYLWERGRHGPVVASTLLIQLSQLRI